MNKLECIVVLAAVLIIIALLFPMYKHVTRDRSEDITYSEPFIIERADYLQGGFFMHPKTVVTTDTGATIILNGIVLVPESGVEVVTRDDRGTITIIRKKQ